MQAQDAATLYSNAKSFIQQSDYDNALLVLKKLVTQQPNNVQYSNTLASVYYNKSELENAQAILDQAIAASIANEETYYQLHNILITNNELAKAERNAKGATKQYPQSGLLYNCYGEVLSLRKDATCIVQWEKGIKEDPNFASNYYNAANFYASTPAILTRLWCIYYGEIFINLEYTTTRSIDVKTIMYNAYKQLATDDSWRTKKSKNEFENALITCMATFSSTFDAGVTSATLTMHRTKCMLLWNTKYSTFTSSLYAKHTALLKEGLFEAYNYWLFESIQNIDSFGAWVKLHQSNYDAFIKYAQNRVFKLDLTDYQKSNN